MSRSARPIPLDRIGQNETTRRERAQSEMVTMLKRPPSTSSSDDDDDDVDCPLSGEQALAACKEFASATKTDTGLAMMMLQKNGWDLARAIDAHRQSTGATSKSNVQKKASEPAVKRFKLLSWNIDGLDEQENTIDIRTRGVVKVIQREQPDAVFLQEVIPVSLDLLRHSLPEYDVHTGATDGYFVVILTRRDLFTVQSVETIAYPETRMRRNLLIVHATYRTTWEIDLMTSHHESGTEDAASVERIEQLKLCFKQMKDAPDNRIVLFGGDLNVREKELRKCSQLMSGIVDLWTETGQRKEARYTWDMNRNTNKAYPSDRFRPRARFDRLYLRPSNDPKAQFKPVYFELEGLEKLASIKRFCSDHWAVQVYFDI